MTDRQMIAKLDIKVAWLTGGVIFLLALVFVLLIAVSAIAERTKQPVTLTTKSDTIECIGGHRIPIEITVDHRSNERMEVHLEYLPPLADPDGNELKCENRR